MAVIAVLFYAPLYLSATMTGLRLIPQAVRGAAGSLGLGYPDARGRSLPLLQICVHFLACSGFLTNYHSTIQRQPTQAETVRTLFDAHVTSGLSTYSLVFVGDLQYIDPSDRQAPTNRTIEYVAFEIQAQVRR
ncbi:hypothetical protein PABG_11424 [Paracoccidioides brasiliensis Pb03]|nr:hypothetical protein PABG_11424 [Paracoccidioides brasiliensis Pb03]